MTARYDPDQVLRLVRLVRLVQEDEPRPLGREGREAGIEARLRDVLRLIMPAVADQLEAMKIEIARLGLVISLADHDSAPAARSGDVGEIAVVRAARDAACRKLGQIAKYADDLDANGGPEDGGSYAYLEVAEALRNILKDAPDSGPAEPSLRERSLGEPLDGRSYENRGACRAEGQGNAIRGAARKADQISRGLLRDRLL